jgi:hypothetical protein
MCVCVRGKINITLGHKTRKETQLKLHKEMALPCLTCGSESWTLRITNERRLGAPEMRFLQYVASYTVWDKERSNGIRSQVGMRKLDKQIRERKKNWLQHLQKMPSEIAPCQLLYYQPIGRRDPRRLRRRWLGV